MSCALDNTAQIIDIFPNTNQSFDVIRFLQAKKRKIEKILKIKLLELKSIKWYITLQVHFIKTNSLGQEDNAYPYFKNKCINTLHKSEIKQQVRKAYASILQKFAEWLRYGSGWVLEKVIQLQINVGKYRPLKGSTYFKLPDHLARKKAIINIQNKDEFCFLWCVLAAIYKVKSHPERVNHYAKYFHTLNIAGLTFPLPINQVSKFEKQNQIFVNVYEYTDNNVYPLYVSKLQDKDCDVRGKVDLLLLSMNGKKHYCLINDISRLLREQGGFSNKRYYCRFCLHGFTTNKLLDNHIELCKMQSPQKVVLPTLENRCLEFKNYHKQDKIKFVIYCDFESILTAFDSCEPNPNKSYTINTHKHVPCAYSYVVTSSIAGYTKPPVTYRGKDVIEHFITSLIKEENEILDVLYRYKPIEMTEDDWEDFLNAKTCHICESDFDDDSLKVRDHIHHDGSFRGASHANCNLKFRLSKKIPVIIHNLKNYDSHLIMQAIGKVGKEKVTCIPTNMEKYVSFSLGNHLTFIDSYQFLSSSLQSLVNNLASEGVEKFDLLTSYITNIEPHLLLRKQVYPYEYMNCWSKFKERNLPSKDQFYNSITEEHITDQDYEHALKVWNKCSFKNLGEMCDFYVKTDTLLLACVFENFRNLCLLYYKLDPVHYVSLPGLTFDACLKFTKVKLDLLTDVDQYLFLEKGIRGGISVISERFAEANNPLLKTYDDSKPTSYITLLDCNNLYGFALSQPLPVSDFKWLTKDEIKEINISALDDNGKGFIFEVDLIYPPELHDLHNLYPLAPEKMKVTKNMLSPYLKGLLNNYDIRYNNPTEKLIPHLGDKKKYVVHYKTLQLYIELGLKIKKIRRVLSFTQKAWVKPYVDFNTEKRKHAKTTFEQDLFKLMLNAFFGKCMENVRKRLRVELVTNSDRLVKLLSKPAFESFKIFNENLVGIHLRKLRVMLDKPIYIGFSILDLSKRLMYEFHYKHMLKKYGDRATLLFTDTDSLCYLLITDDFYKDMQDIEHLFDTSNYPKTHFLYNETKKKAVGFFKDEMGGKPILQFVGLRPKMYSILTDNENKKTAKGVKKATIKKHLRHDQYLKSLIEGKRYSHNMRSIRSKDHILYSCLMKKTSICPLDDKRFLLEGGIKSLAYNHYRLKK